MELGVKGSKVSKDSKALVLRAGVRLACSHRVGALI